jgi:hypothetical protein
VSDHQWNPDSRSLQGLEVVVFARTPREAEHSALSSEVLEAEEAVADIVRAVVAHGGVVTLFGDESLAMVALTVAGEYTTPQLQEEREAPRVLTFIPSREEAGVSREEGGDPFDVFGRFGIGSFERVGNPVRLLADRAGTAAAMVIVGDAPERAIATFREHAKGAPVFAIAASGGLARAVADGYVKEADGVRALDREIEDDPRYALKRDVVEGDENRERVLPPVALAAQRLVEELRDTKGRSNER